MKNKNECPQCGEPHDLSECPRWRAPAQEQAKPSEAHIWRRENEVGKFTFYTTEEALARLAAHPPASPSAPERSGESGGASRFQQVWDDALEEAALSVEAQDECSEVGDTLVMAAENIRMLKGQPDADRALGADELACVKGGMDRIAASSSAAPSEVLTPEAARWFAKGYAACRAALAATAPTVAAPSDASELRRLAMAATQGAWNARVDETVTLRDAADNQLAIFTHINTRTGGRRDADQVAATGRFCAAASPAAIIALLDDADQKRKEFATIMDCNNKMLVQIAALAAPTGASQSAGLTDAPIEWSYSTNEENYHGGENSREAIIQAALADIGETTGTFWIGKNRSFRGRGDASGVIEALQEQAYEECGEYAETYLEDVTKEEERELADLITDWAGRVDRSNFWTVYDTEKIDIAAHLAGATPTKGAL